jgi:hypothetical protein
MPLIRFSHRDKPNTGAIVLSHYSKEKSRYITSSSPFTGNLEGNEMIGSFVTRFVSTPLPTKTIGIDALRFTPLFSNSFLA